MDYYFDHKILFYLNPILFEKKSKNKKNPKNLMKQREILYKTGQSKTYYIKVSNIVPHTSFLYLMQNFLANKSDHTKV